VPTDELRSTFERALAEDRPAALRELILRVALESDDARWAEICCARLAVHRNAHVRGDALAGFGHLARRFGHLDRRRVQRLVEIGLHAHHEYVREQAASAADDIATHLAWRFDRPREG
jgi:hypothetical protein